MSISLKQKLINQFGAEHGSAIVLSMALIAMLSVPLALMHSWVSEMIFMSKTYKSPNAEIDFFVRENMNCARTKSALTSAGGCSPVAKSIAVIAGDGTLMISAAAPAVFKDSTGVTKAQYKVICQSMTQFDLMIAKENSTLNYVKFREYRCP